MTRAASRTASLPTPLRPDRPGIEYRLSDLLERHRCGDTVFLTDDVIHDGAGHDPILYTAHRDVLPARAVYGSDWFADLVEYQPGRLPGGELSRSIGHWNTPSQLEIFQTLTGRVLMLTAWRTSAGEPMLAYQVCSAGTLAAIPFGGWHLTLVLDGPAAVFNFYTDLPDNSALQTPSPTAAGPGKYCRAAPVELTAVRDGPGFAITGSADGIATWGTAQQVSEPGWLRDILADASLPDFYQHADDATLTDLIGQARRLVPACDRTDPR